MECVIGGYRGYDGNLKWQQTLMYHTLKVITRFDWSTLWNISHKHYKTYGMEREKSYQINVRF